MGIEYYVLDHGRREAFELGKGAWGDLYDLLVVGGTPTREAFAAEVADVWCGWAFLTPADYEDQLTWPALGSTRRARELKLADLYALHESGFYARRHDGVVPYDFTADYAYAQQIADRLWAFCEGRWGRLGLIADSCDLPWNCAPPRNRVPGAPPAPPTWRQVDSRYEQDQGRSRRLGWAP